METPLSFQSSRSVCDSHFVEGIVDAIRHSKCQAASIHRLNPIEWFKEASVTGYWARDRRLTPREKEILELVVSGQTMKRIADDLGIRYNTMIAHFRNIHTKLGVHNRAELVMKAVQEKLLE